MTHVMPGRPILSSAGWASGIDETDGLKLIWDNEWVHIRKSGTEPIVRIIVEAESGERAAQLFHDFREEIVGSG